MIPIMVKSHHQHVWQTSPLFAISVAPPSASWPNTPARRPRMLILSLRPGRQTISGWAANEKAPHFGTLDDSHPFYIVLHRFTVSL